MVLLAVVAFLAFVVAYLVVVVVAYLVVPLACLALVSPALALGLVGLVVAYHVVLLGFCVACSSFGFLLNRDVSFLLLGIYSVLPGYIFAFSFHCARSDLIHSSSGA